MRIFWLCPLIQHPVRLNVWMPAIAPVRDGPTGNFALEWSSTDLIRVAKYAVGAAEVTQAQLDAINAVGTINAVEEARWTTQFRDLAAVQRSQLNTFFTTIGETRPAANEVVRDFVQRIAQIIDGKTTDTHLAQLAAKVL